MANVSVEQETVKNNQSRGIRCVIELHFEDVTTSTTSQSMIRFEMENMMAVPRDIIELINTSGNNFHAKVARWFLANGWHVEISPYYLDQTQGKAREIDLIVEKIVQQVTEFPSRTRGLIALRLYIECKFVASNSVFWFIEKDQKSARKLVCRNGDFPENNTYTNEHHYLSKGKIAKLFSTVNNKNTENEPFYKALNQTINGMVSMRGRSIGVPDAEKSRLPIQVLEFPVVVCSSFAPLYAVDFFVGTQPVQISENFQLELLYAYVDRSGNARNDYFLIDFVELEQLDKFITLIERDAEVLKILSSN